TGNAFRLVFGIDERLHARSETRDHSGYQSCLVRGRAQRRVDSGFHQFPLALYPYMSTLFLTNSICTAMILSLVAVSASAQSASLEGSWAFSLPDENPVWMRISKAAGDDKDPTVEFLWSVGSARVMKDVQWEGNGFRFERKNLRWKPFGGKATRYVDGPLRVEPVSPDQLELRFQMSQAIEGPRTTSLRLESLTLIGDRIPAAPQKPDLSRARFGKAIELFNGHDLSGWRLARETQRNGWRAEDGVLVNETPKTDFSGYGEFGNLVSEREFTDFRLELEYNIPKSGNSGVYLRGMYEAQVVDRDSKMQGISGPGAIFGRLTPKQNAGREGGKWNRYVLTLVNRHVTVELNGQIVIDNELLIGCTGGGMRSNDSLPGPILLQGDHTSVRYRGLKLQPFLGFDSSASEN
ncbi:MAG: DUF1080 domain-containing protein, partial [Planctomycetota bacterium]